MDKVALCSDDSVMERQHNHQMEPHLARLATTGGGGLHRGLRMLLDAGFIDQGEAVVFQAFEHQRRHARPDQFHDLIGYESFMNAFSLDDHVDRDFVLHGLQFIDAFEVEWRRAFGDRPVVAILSGPGRSTTFRFHLGRADAAWLADDLESYAQPILKLEI